MYCDATDIQNRLDPKHLIELADDDADGAPDAAVLDAAITDAEGLVDCCLAVRYAVPLDSPPALVRRISADLAIATLFARRRESISPLHGERARLALSLLERLALGRLPLPGVAPASETLPADSTTLGADARSRTDALETY